MVRKALKVNSALELNDAVDLRAAGHHDRAQPRRLFPRQQDEAQDRHLRELDEAVKAYDAGRCDAYTTDASGLYAERLRARAIPNDHIVLPEIISKEPLGPAVRHGDDQWFDIVKWTHFAMVNAEELGVTKANVDDMLKSDNPGHQAPARHRGQARRGDSA